MFLGIKWKSPQYFCDTLTFAESYGIPISYIEAIDKIKPPKTQKKRKRK
jgi:hypothetical protein